MVRSVFSMAQRKTLRQMWKELSHRLSPLRVASPFAKGSRAMSKHDAQRETYWIDSDLRSSSIASLFSIGFPRAVNGNFLPRPPGVSAHRWTRQVGPLQPGVPFIRKPHDQMLQAKAGMSPVSRLSVLGFPTLCGEAGHWTD